MELSVRPVTADRWQELATLFGPSGAFSNCWCTWWRQTGAEFSAGIAQRGTGNRALMHELVEAGREPGLLGYHDGRPVGWISIAPRTHYGRLLRSRALGPPRSEADDPGVWSIVCFWIPRSERGKGVAIGLLAGAIAHAEARGAQVIEAYPIDTAGGRTPDSNVFTGTLPMFRRAGFTEVERRGAGHVIMRRAVAGGSAYP